MNVTVDLGEHTLPCAQRTPPHPQREVTLQIFSADLVTHPLRNPLLKGNFYSLDTVHEGLLHCMLQTPVLACSLGYFENPDLFTRLFPKLRYIPNFLGSAVAYAGPPSPPRRFFFFFWKLWRILNLLGSALLHSCTWDQRRRNNSLSPSLRYTPNFLGRLLLVSFTQDQHHLFDCLLPQRSTRSQERRNSASWRAPP